MSNIKETIRQEIDTRRQHMVEELMGHEENCEYHRIKGMHDAYVDLLTFLDYSLPEETCKDSLQVQETCKENTDSFTSLEEAANDSWVLYEYRDTPQGLYSSCYRDGFIAGAKWQKEQDATQRK